MRITSEIVGGLDPREETNQSKSPIEAHETRRLKSIIHFQSFILRWAIANFLLSCSSVTFSVSIILFSDVRPASNFVLINSITAVIAVSIWVNNAIRSLLNSIIEEALSQSPKKTSDKL